MERWFPVNTKRLQLRELLAADESDIHEYAADPLVSRYDTWGPDTAMQTHEVLARWIAAQQRWPREDVHLGAELKEEGRVIGSMRLWTIEPASRTAEIGYTFHRKYWNKGYATEAVSALLAVAFLTLDFHRVVATCDTRNAPSWRVMEKAGMRREGTFLRDKLQKGEWRDTHLYAILAEEWRKRHPAL
jgi:[ribosomal protein S5]-alanine N-acetyltransferase